MKTICAILLMLLSAASALAADIKLGWDPAPAGEVWTAVRIYERTGTGPFSYVKVGEVAGTAVEITLTGITPGVHTYIARAYNVWESADSNAVTTPPVPATPGNLKFTIVVTISGTTVP